MRLGRRRKDGRYYIVSEFRNPDFGSLGAAEDPGTELIDDKEVETDETGLPSTPSSKDMAKYVFGGADAGAGSSGGGGMIPGVGSGGLALVCTGCNHTEKNLIEEKKAELEKKYPLRDCNPYKDLVDSSEYDACLKFNEEQLRKRDAELANYVASLSNENGKGSSPAVVAGLQLLIQLCNEMVAYKPSTIDMTLMDVYRTERAKFVELYTRIQTQYAPLKNIDVDTLMTLNPMLNAMTLREIINRAQNMVNGAQNKPPVSIYEQIKTPLMLGGAALAVGVLLALVLGKKKK